MCVVYLLSEQTKLRQLGGRFLLEKKGKRQASIPMDEVECVIQGKAAEITTPAIYELLARGVCIFYVDGRGRLLGQLGQFASSNLSWERSRIQYETFRDEQRQVELTREIVRLKMDGQIELLRSYAKSKKDLELAYLADEVRKYRKKVTVTADIEVLCGLNQDMYAFGLFFQDMLNAGLGAAACDEADAYMPLLNDAATTLIAYSQLAAAPAEQDRGALQDVEAKRDKLHEVEHRCKAEFYRYYASLELPKQELLEQARERDALAVADRLVEAISELRDLFEQGIYEVNQKVDDLHEDMTERFDAVDDALADVQGVLENMTGDIRRLQQRRNCIWRFLD